MHHGASSRRLARKTPPDGFGHAPYLDDPDALARRILAFTAEVHDLAPSVTRAFTEIASAFTEIASAFTAIARAFTETARRVTKMLDRKAVRIGQ